MKRIFETKMILLALAVFMSIQFSGNAFADYDEGELIIKVDEQYASEIAEMKDDLEVYEVRVLDAYAQMSGGYRTTLSTQYWRYRSTLPLNQLISSYTTRRYVSYVEPNYKIYPWGIPDDSDFSEQWGMNNTGQSGGKADADIDAPEAWDYADGKPAQDVTVAVIDSGVDCEHPDLAGQCVAGYNVIDSSELADDDHGHGTHIAGTIAALRNNSSGITGVCGSAKIMPIKFFDAEGVGKVADAVRGLNYARDMGAKIVNASWTIGGERSFALEETIAKAQDAGQLFVAAAGNGGPDHVGDDNDVNPDYPSGYELDNIISVASTDHDDALSVHADWSSNYGATSVDLAAPGSGIYSTLPGNDYGSDGGTSMAAAHVSGVASLIWALEPELSYTEVRQRILDSADRVPALAGKSVTGGRLNAHKAVALNDGVVVQELIFTDSGQEIGSSTSYGVALGDMDGDGDLDAFVANHSNQPDKVWLNDGDGNFTDSGQDLDPSNSYSNSVILIDLDADGDLDAFVLHNSGRPSKVWWNDGKGFFTDSGQNLYNSDAWGIDLGDLDGDGDPDAYIANAWNKPDKVWLNDGSGNFSDSGQLIGRSHSLQLSLGDIDGDGDIDAVIPSRLGESDKIWLNDGLGHFSDSGQSLEAPNSITAQLADLDGDNDLDIFTAHGSDISAGEPDSVWLNDGEGNFVSNGQSLGHSSAKGLVLSDIDDDGDVDAFVTNRYNQPNKLWLNDGHGNFTDSGLNLGNSISNGGALGDLDGDGDLDIFVANQGANKVWLNQSYESYLTLTDGLVAYYPFNGNANDESGNENHGIENAVEYVPGTKGQSVSFDGNGAFIKVPDADSLDTDSIMTIATWINPKKANAPNAIFASKWYSARLDGDWHLSWHGNTDNRLMFTVANYSEFGIENGSTNVISGVASKDSWQHVAVVFDNGHIKTYLNGVLVQEVTSIINRTSKNEYNTDSIFLGQLWKNNYGYKGLMDDFRIYNRTLSDSEIQQLYSGQSNPAENADTDEDELPDDWEITHFGNLDQTGTTDYDDDGLTNLEEYKLGTDPTNPDTDDDKWTDIREHTAGTDPNNPEDHPTPHAQACSGTRNLTIPLTLNNTEKTGIEGLDLKFEYDENVLIARHATLEGGVLQDRDYEMTYQIEDGEISISIYAEDEAFTGNGVIAHLSLYLAQETEGLTELKFTKANLNETAMSTENIMINITPENCDNEISGAVRYYSDDAPVSNVLLELEGSASHSATTGEDGKYKFSVSQEPGDYTLTPRKNDHFGGLSGMDASRIGKYAADFPEIEFDCYQMIAADVDMNGRITGRDASRVARYTAGKINYLNNNDIQWAFVPTQDTPGMTGICSDWPPVTYASDREYSLLDSDKTDQDFIAIRLGDVTGNWTSEPVREKRDSGPVCEVSAAPGSALTLPIVINRDTAIEGIDIKLEFDETVLELTGATLTGGILEKEDYFRISNAAHGEGTILISGNGDTFTGSGQIVFVSFSVIGETENDAPVLSITSFECNEMPALGGFRVSGEVCESIRLGTDDESEGFDPRK